MSLMDDRHRLFFALWPEDSVREQIELRTRAAVLESGGRPIAPRNFHITLMFMGNVGRDGLARAQDTAAALTSPAFTLSLDRIQSPSRAHVMWLAAPVEPVELLALARALRAIPVVSQADHSFRAHVTLVRDPVHRLPTREVEPILWPARDFVLVSSQLGPGGSEYTVIGRWPLEAEGRET
jgi:RNA 2',3'-cyclic 3'-phosphodiesterase